MGQTARSSPAQPDCAACHGTRYQITKRTMRPRQQPSFSEQAAQNLLATKDQQLIKAANTLDAAAERFLLLGEANDAAQTRQAAAAVRACVTGEAG